MKVYVAIRDTGAAPENTIRDVLGVFSSKARARAHIWSCSSWLRDEDVSVRPGSYSDTGDYISGNVNGWWHEYFYKPFEVDAEVDDYSDTE